MIWVFLYRLLRMLAEICKSFYFLRHRSLLRFVVYGGADNMKLMTTPGRAIIVSASLPPHLPGHYAPAPNEGIRKTNFGNYPCSLVHEICERIAWMISSLSIKAQRHNLNRTQSADSFIISFNRSQKQHFDHPHHLSRSR